MPFRIERDGSRELSPARGCVRPLLFLAEPGVWGFIQTVSSCFAGHFHQGLQLPGVLQHAERVCDSLGAQGKRGQEEVGALRPFGGCPERSRLPPAQPLGSASSLVASAWHFPSKPSARVSCSQGLEKVPFPCHNDENREQACVKSSNLRARFPTPPFSLCSYSLFPAARSVPFNLPFCG